MTEVVCKAVKGISAGFTGETRRVGLVYDFAVDGGAYSGKVYTLANIEGPVLIEKVIVRVATIVTSGGSATVVVGNTDNADAYVDATGGALANIGAVVVVAAAATSLPSILHDGDQITMTIGTADLTAGKIVVEVWYKDVNVG
jgi:hypothetical protein